MSLMLMAYGSQGVRAAAVPPLPEPSSITLTAVYRTWGSPTDSTARFTIPLAPNHGYTTDDVRVFRLGGEQPIYIEELRGRHNNGSGGDGGARAFFVECSASGWIDGDLCEIRLGDGERGTTDLSASGRGSMAMLRTHWEHPRVILCTDPDYLCSTWATFHPLVPDTDKHPDDIAWAVTRRDQVIALREPPPAGQNSGNWYDLGWSAFAWWCETGNPEYWRRASLYSSFRFTYNSPPRTDNPDPSLAGHSTTIHLNPEGIAGSVVNGAAEWWSMVNRETATAYLCTGYGQFWRNLNGQCIQIIGRTDWFSRTLGTISGARFNFGRLVTPLIYGSLLDCTFVMPTGGYAGGAARRQPSWVADLPHVLTQIDNTALPSSMGYLEGFRGSGPAQNGGNELGNLPCSVGDEPTFQRAMGALAMIDWYLNVRADAQLLDWIETNVRVVLANVEETGVGTIGTKYLNTRYVKRWIGAIADPFDGGIWRAYRRGAGILNNVVNAYTSTTVTFASAASVLADDELNGMTVGFQSSSGSGPREFFTITDYDAATRTATFDGPLTLSGTLRAMVFIEEDSDDPQIVTADAVTDLHRAVQFMAALKPTETINGRTYAEWRDAFRANMVISESGYSSEWPESPAGGSTFGRWWPTHGCYFTRFGVPAGPSAIREPVLWESA